jgi:hypothetical protein
MEPVYERLRAEVLCGRARPDGLGVLLFHGFAEGLTLLCRSAGAGAAVAHKARTTPASGNRELLHLLANMVLQTQSGVSHVY